MSSKWNYIFTGICAMNAVLCAATHDGILLVLNALLVLINWHLAENRRKYEEVEIIFLYETQKAEAKAENEKVEDNK